jgi:hypothetical protein
MSTDTSPSAFVYSKKPSEPSEPSEPSATRQVDAFRTDGSKTLCVRTVSTHEPKHLPITLAEAVASGITLTNEAGKLKYCAPSGLLSPELFARIKASKLQLLREISEAESENSKESLKNTTRFSNHEYEKTSEHRDWSRRPFNPVPNETGLTALDVIKLLPTGKIDRDQYLKAWQSLKNK